MGIPLTLKKKQQAMRAPPTRLLDDSSSSSTNSVRVTECKLSIADAMRFLTDVKAAGKSLPMAHWLHDFTEKGFHSGLITRAEEIFEVTRNCWWPSTCSFQTAASAPCAVPK